MLDIMTLQVTPFAQDCRILAHQETSDAVVVDPGGDAQLIISVLEQQGLKLKAILLTHAHLDHVGGTKDLLDHYPQVKVYGPHRDDEFLLQSLNQQAQMFGIDNSGSFECEYVGDGEVLKLFDDASFKVLHTPGHTPGGVCYYCQEENFVIVGDTLFPGSIGRTDFPRGNFADLINSIKTKLFTLPDSTDVFCGHMGDTTIGEEKASNPYVRQLIILR